jgi:outer membrane protein assembly factor BamB
LQCAPVGGNAIWSFTGDGQLTTAPITLGSYVIEGSGTGMLYVLDQTTGAVVWSANVGAPIPAPIEGDQNQPLTGLGAANGVLIVPAGSQVSAYAPM